MLRPLKLSDTRIAALFLVSAAILAFEIEIMRIFAVASWSNFGSMVISIALLGFGLAGTLLALAARRLRANPDAWLFAPAFALAPTMAAAYAVAQHVPFSPVLITSDATQLWWIAAYYGLYAVPFFAAGLFIGGMFTVFASRIHALYFWNMAGSGLGGLLLLGFLFLFPPEFLIYPLVAIAAMPAFLCSVQWRAGTESYRLRAGEIIACVVSLAAALFLVARFGALRVSDFKAESYAQRYPDASLVHSSFSPLGEMHVYASSYFHFAPGLSDNAAAALPRMPRNAFLGLFVDGNGPVGIMRKLATDEESYVDYLPMSAPYRIRPNPRVLTLRLGGGAGVHTALHGGARSVTVVESNGDLLRMLRDDPFFRAYTGNFLADARVRVVNSEIRAFAGSTPERFDLVEIGLIDSIGLSQAGGYSVDENYVYTVEAISDYLRCLAPAGILSITVWDRLSPPRNVPKLLTTVVTALRRAGVRDPGRSIFAFNLLLSTATVLVRNGPFTDAETASLTEFCRRMSFDVAFSPRTGPGDSSTAALLAGYRAAYGSAASAADTAASAGPDLIPSALYRGVVQWMIQGRQEELYAGYPFDIRPATDDRPYYSGYLKPRTIPALLARAGEFPEEWGYLLLLGTLLQSLLFGALVILVPAAARAGALAGCRGGPGTVLAYFGILGLGYMLAEIYLIQRFVFYLADPVYANTIIITALLVSSGCGSLMTSRLPGQARVIGASILIVGFCIFFALGLSPVLRLTLGLPLAARAGITALIVAPFGACLGIPFPSGLGALASRQDSLLPWAWGVNGALSVTGAVLTRVLSTAFGFRVVLLAMAVLYAGAGLLFPALSAAARREARPAPRAAATSRS